MSPSTPLRLAACLGGLLLALGSLSLPAADVDSGSDVDLTLDARGQAFTNSVGMRLVPIPRGKFTMGSPKDEKERAPTEEQHEVEISRNFHLAATEVTQKQYKQVMGVNPSGFTGDDNLPVESVTWQNAQNFCAKLSALPAERQLRRVYRLPTEAEWEYACRAGAKTRFHWGDGLTAKQANFSASGLGKTCKVASYPANAWGLHDMHGNVWEWTADWHDPGYYKISPRLDPRGPAKGDNHVMRGGCWFDGTNYNRSACRYWNGHVTQDRGLGFRVALMAAR
jgi:formylglycine-generating enzyme required for sulfatase activity